MSTAKKSVAGAGLVLMALCLNNAAPNYLQYQISPIAMQVMETYKISMEQYSSLFTSPMIPAILFSLIVGLLFDKLGPVKVMRFGVLIAAIGGFVRLYTGGGYTALFVGTLMTGFSAAFINAGQAKIVAGFYPLEQIQSKIGLINASSTAAMIITMATTAYFSSVSTAFLVAAVFMAAAAISWFLFGKNPETNEAHAEPVQKSFGELMKASASSRQVWLMAFSLFGVLAGQVVMSSWAPTALQSVGMAATTAGYMGSLYTVGNFISCFLGPILAGKLRSIRKVILIFGIVAVVGLIFSWKISNPILCGAMMILTGIAIGGNIPLAMGDIINFKGIGPEYVGTASGLVATIQLIGAVVLPSYVLIPIASGNFNTLFILAAACMAISAVLGYLAHSN